MGRERRQIALLKHHFVFDIHDRIGMILMEKQTFFLLLLCWSGCFNHSDNSFKIFQKVYQLNQQMEAIFEEGNPGELARFYNEDAIVFGLNDKLVGRPAIKKYWERIKSPVSLSIEVLDLNAELDSLKFIQKNRSVKEEIPQAFLDQLDQDLNSVFQLTKTTLAYEREDVTFYKGETISLINWQEQSKGIYQIKRVWLMQ